MVYLGGRLTSRRKKDMGLNESLLSDVILYNLVQYNDFYEGMVKKVGLMITFSMMHLLCHSGQDLVEVVG